MMRQILRQLAAVSSRQRRGCHRRGAIVVLAALLMVVLMIFVALALDTGYVCLTRTQLQNAADAAALAGATKLAAGPAAARLESRSYASANVVAGNSLALTDGDIELGQWNDQSASFVPLPQNEESQANAVRVTCPLTAERGNPLRLFFASVSGTPDASVIARATARIKVSRCSLIVGLSSVTMSGSAYTDSFRSSIAAYNPSDPGTSGHVCSNGRITMSGSAAIHGDAHPGPSEIVNSSSSIGVTGATVSLANPLVYAPIDAGNTEWDNDNASIPLSDDGIQPLSGGTFSLSGGDGVDLPPGEYYFDKLTLSGGSHIRISGMTVVYVKGDCNMSGGRADNATGLAKNLQLFAMGKKTSISGSYNFCGVVYGPDTDFDRSGDADFIGAIVAKKITLDGNGGIHADESLDYHYLNTGNPKSGLVD